MATANRMAQARISLEGELAGVADRLRRVTVQIRNGRHGIGSGVIWSRDGLIVTNAHVATAETHEIELYDGRVLKGTLQRRDASRDLAALRVDAAELDAAEIRDASTMRAGELVLAVGNPMGVKGAFTTGMLCEVPRDDATFMRADIRLAPGNSGGPLADVHCNVIGINGMIVDGFGVAVTSRTVERFLSRRRIGATMQLVDAVVGASARLGLLVTELEPGGAAHLSGLMVGDVVVQANAEWLTSAQHLQNAIGAAVRTLEVHVVRGGRLQACRITLRAEAESAA